MNLQCRGSDLFSIVCEKSYMLSMMESDLSGVHVVNELVCCLIEASTDLFLL